MSVIKITGEYKVKIEFEAERESSTKPIEDIQDGVCKFPDELCKLLEDELGSGTKVWVTEVSAYVEEA